MAKASKAAPGAREPVKSGPGGRPRHKPSPASRQLVETLAGYGFPHEEIAALVPVTELRAGENPEQQILGIDEKSLRKWYRKELDTGALKAKAQTMNTLHRLANGSPAQFNAQGQLVRAEQPVNVSALIFKCKAQYGMREKITVGGDPDAPLKINLGELTDGQLDQLYQRLTRQPTGAG